MKLKDAASVLNAKVMCCEENLETEISSACGSDLMSDVMAFVKEEAMLLTGLVNIQVIRTAEMMDMKAIVFVRGKKPDDAMIELAKNRGIALLTTNFRMYLACGKLYTNGMNRDDN